jgi:hypothetical protein
MSQVNEFHKSINNDLVYFDVLATNCGFKNTTASRPTPLTFNQTRSVPIINNTGEYNMSITRFSLDTPRLPVLAVQPLDGSPFYPRKTIYKIGYQIIDRYTKAILTDVIDNIYWDSEDPSLAPPATYPGNTATLEYYHCHSYKYFLELVNITLNSLFIFTTDVPTLAIRNRLFPASFSWDEQTQSIVLYCNQLFNEAEFPLARGTLNNTADFIISHVPLIKIIMNEHLYALFAGFASSFNSTTGLYSLRIFNTNYPNEAYKNYILDYTTPSATNTAPYANSIPVFDLVLNSVVPPSGTGILYNYFFEGINLIVKSEISGCNLWSPVASIVFTTSLIPVVSNQLSSPIIYEDGKITNVNPSANFAQVITDFIAGDQGMRPNILYNPTAEYRRIQLYGNSPLTNFDISVFWKSKYGEFIPFLLPPGASASIKILFEKKK